MTPSFVFEPPSDEEYLDEEQGLGDGNFQSSWDFASYFEIVSQEHARGSTTSVDFKITKALQQQLILHHSAADEDDEGISSECESDKQVSPHYSFLFIWLLNIILFSLIQSN